MIDFILYAGMEMSDEDEATELIDEILESGEYGKA